MDVDYSTKVDVKIANGDIIHSKCYCNKVITKLQDQSFTISIFLHSLDGCDMVLGVRWSETLGPIVWDIAKLTMEFCHESSKVKLQELKVKEFTVESITKSLLTALDKGKGLLV